MAGPETLPEIIVAVAELPSKNRTKPAPVPFGPTLLPEIVLNENVALPLAYIPPPATVAALSLIVVLVRCEGCVVYAPPPRTAELPLIVELFETSAPTARPPPSSPPSLSLTVELLSVTSPA